MAIAEKSIEQYISDGGQGGQQSSPPQWAQEAGDQVLSIITGLANLAGLGSYADELLKSGRVNSTTLTGFINRIGERINYLSGNKLAKIESMLNSLYATTGTSDNMRRALSQMRTKLEAQKRSETLTAQKANMAVTAATNAANRYAARTGAELASGKGDADIRTAVSNAREAEKIYGQKGDYDQKL